MYRAKAAGHLLERVLRAAMLLEEREPLLRQHVRVDVDDRLHCSFTPARRITSAHLRVSSRIMAPNSAGVVASGSAPAASTRVLISGAASAALISAFNRSMIGAGVPAGATAPNQPIAS